MTIAELPAKPATKMLVTIYCSKLNRRTGVMCNHKLAHVDVDRWEEDMSSHAELFCDNCKNVYTLADYLGMR